MSVDRRTGYALAQALRPSRTGSLFEHFVVCGPDPHDVAEALGRRRQRQQQQQQQRQQQQQQQQQQQGPAGVSTQFGADFASGGHGGLGSMPATAGLSGIPGFGAAPTTTGAAGRQPEHHHVGSDAQDGLSRLKA